MQNPLRKHHPPPSPNGKNYNSDLQRFYFRLTARLVLIFMAITQVLSRVIIIVLEPRLPTEAKIWFAISLPFFALMSLIVGIEFLLFKKLGPRIVKYSNTVDILLMILFTAEWLLNIFAGLSPLDKTDATSMGISGVFNLTSFGWRTLIMIILVQYWQLKIIPPILALGLVLGYTIYYAPWNLAMSLMKAILQMFYTVILFYCEDKIKWNTLLGSVQQEKWMQINDFILNNIPENIMILDLDGNTKFISDYCRSFLLKCHLSLDIRELFQKVQDLTEQPATAPSSPTSINEEDAGRQNTVNGLIEARNEPRENEKDLESLITHFKGVIKDRSIQEREFLIYNGKLKVENHKEKSIELKLSYIHQSEREYIILILRDTTQRDMLVTLADTNKYKDQLLASVSHELRAPLNGNINLVESAINSPKVPDIIKESLLIPALRSSKFLLHLINDILDMSQIKEKKLRLNFQPGDLRETLKSTSQLVELQAKKKDIELQVELDPGLPKKFCTDHVRLSQIILNLLNNAIKFTQNGTVKLIATVAENTPQWIKISVQDSGIGMSQEDLSKLFSNFTHIEFEGRQVMNPAGVGLGLKIASNLADLLAPEGQQGISVESLPGQGSIFSLIIEDKELPELDIDLDIDKEKSQHSIYNVSDEQPGDINPTSFLKLQTQFTTSAFIPQKEMANTESEKPLLRSLSACACPEILVVDDNPFNTMAFETILSSLDIKCESVYTGQSAIKKLLSCEGKKCGKDCKLYSVVFMDQEMPEMSGTETVKEIRRLQRENQIPKGVKIIGCTAHQQGEEVDRFKEAGLDQCIHKPISAAIVKNVL